MQEGFFFFAHGPVATGDLTHTPMDCVCTRSPCLFGPGINMVRGGLLKVTAGRAKERNQLPRQRSTECGCTSGRAALGLAKRSRFPVRRRLLFLPSTCLASRGPRKHVVGVKKLSHQKKKKPPPLIGGLGGKGRVPASVLAR